METIRGISTNKLKFNTRKNETKEQRSLQKKRRSSPPQQKPAAPIAETPLLFKASITGFASSNPFSYPCEKQDLSINFFNNCVPQCSWKPYIKFKTTTVINTNNQPDYDLLTKQVDGQRSHHLRLQKDLHRRSQGPQQSTQQLQLCLQTSFEFTTESMWY